MPSSSIVRLWSSWAVSWTGGLGSSAYAGRISATAASATPADHRIVLNVRTGMSSGGWVRMDQPRGRTRDPAFGAPEGRPTVARGGAERNPWNASPPTIHAAPEGRPTVARGGAERNPWNIEGSAL